MARNLIFCFDGTSNEPADAAQGETRLGGVEDNNISNVLKLHLIFGGDLNDGNRHNLDQLSLYYSGVGTYGAKHKRIFNAALALTDVGRILEMAFEDLDIHWQSGDRIFVFGFSRGAAIARKFCSELSKTRGHKQKKVSLLGVFDTVASIGMPDLSTEEPPETDVIFEDHFIASNIKEALHLVSIDDKRKAFQPTLINAEDRVTEVWFAGAHSDVGGGYRRDGLSDIALRFMLDELDRRKTGIQKVAPSEIKYGKIKADAEDIDIELEDVIVEPNIFGLNHQQSRPWPISEFTLYDREVVVLEANEYSEREPLIHHTVAERIYGDSEYRPAGLKQQPHKILYPDQNTNLFQNLGHHIRVGMRALRPLDVGESAEVPVYAHQFHNRTGLVLEKGKTYKFKVRGTRKWKDGDIECSADGWKRNRPGIGWIKELAIGRVEFLRREPDEDWFKLIGAVGDNDDETFAIGTATARHSPKKSDEFCPFANDLKRLYSNNDGFLVVAVECVA